MPHDPFAKKPRASQEPASTPWSNGALKCWLDGFGCSNFRDKVEFRHHPHLCAQCCSVIAHKYGLQPGDAGIFMLEITGEESRMRQIKSLGAAPDRLKFLETTKEVRLAEYLPRLVKSFKIKEANVEAFRVAIEYWRALCKEAGVEPGRGARLRAADTMTTPAEVIKTQ